MEARRLGRSGILVSPLGLGTARVGGLGYSRAGDRTVVLVPEAVEESKRAIRTAVGHGVTFFDTADIYGAGRVETLLGEAIRGVRPKLVIATKFGELFNEKTGDEPAGDVTPEYVRQACDASLRRLGTDVIDLYLFHLRDFPLEEAGGIRDALERLVDLGKIRFYGWSTDDPERARLFAKGPHCAAIELRLNLFDDAPEMLALCEEEDLASVIRVPLLMGILTGRWHRGDSLADSDRRSDGFRDERFLRILDRAEAVRPVLTRSGRSYVQGAIAWIWARSPRAVPVPGFRTVAQAEELADTMRHGAMSPQDFEAVNAQIKAPP
ncbi:MAG: aldo/keto reductase [Candidatus Bipolaricaulis sp.]|nr:aldo/keto reductase [Candidatus Bipolaricaulis sp.]